MSLHRRAAGFTLLPVLLTMTLIAAIAFLLNRDNGMNAGMIAGQMDADRARYAAEAGLQAVNARVQSLSCTGGFPTVGAPVVHNIGSASYSAYATSASGNTTGLVSIGTYNGTSVTLTRNNIYVYQSAPKTYTLQPDSVKGIDTALDPTNEVNFGADSSLKIKSGQNHLLFKFDLSAFPAGSRPVAATFSMYGIGLAILGFDLYRMTHDWVEGASGTTPPDGATWNTLDGSTAWTPGGNFHPVKLSSAGIVLAGWADFNVTDLAAAWLSGQYTNQGVLVSASSGAGQLQIVSSDNTDAVHRPKLTFNYLLPCGTTGPVDPTGATATLNPVADSFNDSGAALANNGVATTLKTYYTPVRENRILMQFDTSSIAAGSMVQSAKLRLFVSAVGNKTANTKSVWANALNESWAEGAGNNTNKSCPTATAGTSWNYRTNCTNWSYIHPPNTAQVWTAMANMSTARTFHMTATVNNKIYAIGGFSPSGGYLKVVEEYDPATNTWATKAAMPTARSDAVAVVVNGKIYVIGGTSNGITPLKTNEEYDPVANTWATKAPMPTARMYAAAAMANNTIYVLGGSSNGSTALRTNEQYNPATNIWATKTQMPSARMWFSAQGVNNMVYALGGWSGIASLTVNEAYDPVANTWTTKAALPVGTDSMASAALGNRIYLVSGYQNTVLTNKVWMYDAINNAYTAQANYPVSFNQPAAAALNNKLYSMGGDNGTSVFANHYQYDPGTPVPVATASDEATAASPLASNFNGGWINFDLKPLVQEWVDGVRPNNGVVIYTEVADQFSMGSRENSTNKPELIVTY